MMRLRHFFVWLSRLGHCRGFGIQSPTDYAFVRYVINEHWSYYQYADLGKEDGWLKRKLGRLYFRIANWRQPATAVAEGYEDYVKAGCQSVIFDGAEGSDLMLLKLEGDYRSRMASIYKKVKADSVVIIEGIRKDKVFWQEVTGDERTGVTFDLYYCGIVMFDKKRHKKNYIINF